MGNNDKYLETIKLYKSVFDSENGKKVLWDLMKVSGYTTTNFDENPYKTAYNEGARSMVTRVINLVEMDASKIKTMLDEHRKADEYERYNING